MVKLVKLLELANEYITQKSDPDAKLNVEKVILKKDDVEIKSAKWGELMSDPQDRRVTQQNVKNSRNTDTRVEDLISHENEYKITSSLTVGIDVTLDFSLPLDVIDVGFSTTLSLSKTKGKEQTYRKARNRTIETMVKPDEIYKLEIATLTTKYEQQFTTPVEISGDIKLVTNHHCKVENGRFVRTRVGGDTEHSIKATELFDALAGLPLLNELQVTIDEEEDCAKLFLPGVVKYTEVTHDIVTSSIPTNPSPDSAKQTAEEKKSDDVKSKKEDTERHKFDFESTAIKTGIGLTGGEMKDLLGIIPGESRAEALKNVMDVGNSMIDNISPDVQREAIEKKNEVAKEQLKVIADGGADGSTHKDQGINTEMFVKDQNSPSAKKDDKPTDEKQATEAQPEEKSPPQPELNPAKTPHGLFPNPASKSTPNQKNDMGKKVVPYVLRGISLSAEQKTQYQEQIARLIDSRDIGDSLQDASIRQTLAETIRNAIESELKKAEVIDDVFIEDAIGSWAKNTLKTQAM